MMMMIMMMVLMMVMIEEIISTSLRYFFRMKLIGLAYIKYFLESFDI